jgi:hypothetical protein
MFCNVKVFLHFSFPNQYVSAKFQSLEDSFSFTYTSNYTQRTLNKDITTPLYFLVSVPVKTHTKFSALKKQGNFSSEFDWIHTKLIPNEGKR